MYSDEELKARSQEWLKSASTDPIKKERIQLVQTLLKDIKYRSAQARQEAIDSFSASGLDMQFILEYAEQVKKAQGVLYGQYR